MFKIIERIPEIESAMTEAIFKETNCKVLTCFESYDDAEKEGKLSKDVFYFIDSLIEALKECNSVKLAKSRARLTGFSNFSIAKDYKLSCSSISDLLGAGLLGYSRMNIKDITKLISNLKNVREAIVDDDAVYYAFNIDEEFNVHMNPINAEATPLYKIVFDTDDKSFEEFYRNKTDMSLKFKIDETKTKEGYSISFDGLDKSIVLECDYNGNIINLIDESCYINTIKFFDQVSEGCVYTYKNNDNLTKKIQDVKEWFVCKDCYNPFYMPTKDIIWFKMKGLEAPKRCKKCRDIRKEAKIRERSLKW